jgi:c-di-GMP-binding flagellar brake protein YcgR
VPIQAQGTVVRVERGGRRGLAVQFTSLNPTTRETIENFVFEARMETALKVA